MWINTKLPLAMLQSQQAPRIKGYVGEENVFRFKVGSTAKFVPENPELPIVTARVSDVAEASSQQLDKPYLALPFGGSIAVEETRKEELRPMRAAYALALEPAAGLGLSQPKMAVRGVAILQGEPQSFYERAKLQVLKVLVRELGAQILSIRPDFLANAGFLSHPAYIGQAVSARRVKAVLGLVVGGMIRQAGA